MKRAVQSNGVRSLIGAFVFATDIAVANAQNFANVGELLDKGGQRVDAVALKALLTGATASGRSLTLRFVSTDVNYSSDGRMSGTGFSTIGGDPPWPLEGTWRITDQGFLCVEGSSRYGSFKGCLPYYRHGETYYQAESDERGARLRVREIKRN